MNASPNVAEAAPPLRKLKERPTQAYQIRVNLKDAPGPFQVVYGVSQYDVTNAAQCGKVNEVAGIAGDIASNEDIVLTKVSDTEYTGVLYADQILDEDYYGRGVCHWALTEARVVLRGTGEDADTYFVSAISAEEIRNGGASTRYFWEGYYPRSRMEAFRDLGNANLEAVPEDKRGEFFVVDMSAKAVTP